MVEGMADWGLPFAGIGCPVSDVGCIYLLQNYLFSKLLAPIWWFTHCAMYVRAPYHSLWDQFIGVTVTVTESVKFHCSNWQLI